MDTRVTRKRRRCRLRKMSTQELLERYKALPCWAGYHILATWYETHYYPEEVIRRWLVSALAKYPVKKEVRRAEVMAEQNEVKVGEVYLLPVRVTSRNVNMEREYLAVEPVGMEVPELVLSPDGTRLLYVKAEQLKKES